MTFGNDAGNGAPMYKLLIVAVLYAVSPSRGEVELLRQTAEIRAKSRESCQLLMLNWGTLAEQLMRADVQKNAAQLFKHVPTYKKGGKIVRSSLACVER